MLPVLILRPADSARQTLKRAKKLGLDCVADPLFSIQSKPWIAPPKTDFDAVMYTSANAVHYSQEKLNDYRDLPVVCVGRATAKSAREAGFRVAITGDGGADDLIGLLPGNKYTRILRLTGKHHIKIARNDRQITIRQVYESVAQPLGRNAQGIITSENVTLLHSARAATILRSEMDRLGLERTHTHIAALSENIATAAGTGWKSVQAASVPTDDALLSLASALCG